MADDIATQDDVRQALIEGEFKRLVRYDAALGEQEKKHLIAAAERVLKLAEQSVQSSVYDLPPIPVNLYVLTITSTVMGASFSHIFADLDHAVISAKRYAMYAGWMRNDKDKDNVVEQVSDGSSFHFRMFDKRSGDFATVTNARLSYHPLFQSTNDT